MAQSRDSIFVYAQYFLRRFVYADLVTPSTHNIRTSTYSRRPCATWEFT